MDRITFTASTTGTDRAKVEAELEAQARRFYGMDTFARLDLAVDASPSSRRCDGTVTAWTYRANATYVSTLP